VALSDLAVFSEYAYDTMTEVTRQQVDLFNGASRNAIMLSGAAHQGDYSERAFYKKISGLVKRRNAYGAGAVAAKTLQHLVDTMVKVAAGTPPVSLDPGQFKWIQQNPEVAGATMGQQLAKDAIADMLNIGITSTRVALNQVAAIKYDGTADTPNTLDAPKLNKGAAKFGDQSKDIAVWVVHSKSMHDYFGTAITNAAQLFKYETVNVIADPFGRVFIVTDAPGLIVTGAPDTYHALGLTVGAIEIDQNNDFTDNYETKNGDENILRTYQAEWSYNLGIKGFSWDKTNGGKSPNDAALAVATNWDRYATSDKDLAGVLIACR
jgi:Major capsid protein 13-like